MKLFSIKLSATFLFVFFVFKSGAQVIDKTLEAYAKEDMPEKIYVHYDKTSYGAGETIWFKAYLMKGMFPASDAKTAYVDWIGEDGKLLLHSVCAVENATTFGQFEIPQNYKGSLIHVRAYTRWLFNFDPEYWYDKNIRIVTDEKTVAAEETRHPQITFFPEGGDAIAGILNKIVFKADDQYGNPINIKGIVKNSTGSVIDSLHVIHDGMGFFFIRPQADEKFTAEWQDESGESYTTALPAIKNTGVGLRVTISGNRRNFLVSASPASKDSISTVHVIGTMYHQKLFDLNETMNNGSVEGTIPTDNLPSGILTLTVFDNTWKPLAERITFINNGEYAFHPEISVTEKGTNKRQKNEISISLPEGIASDLSVSVTDARIDYDGSDNIISHLLLSSELKGKIHDPAYYFINNSDSITRQLDLVMLTHGWRKINWEKIVKGELPNIQYPADTSYLSLSGIVYGATETQLKKAKDIILMIGDKNSGTQTFTIPLNPDGTFNDPSLILFDTAHIYYSLSNMKNQDKISVRFMQDVIQPVPTVFDKSHFDPHPFYDEAYWYHKRLNDSVRNQIRFFQGKVLQTVTIKSKIKSNKELLNEKYTKGVFQNRNATELDLANDPLATSYTDIISYLEGKVPGLTYDHQASKFLWMRNRGGENAPTLYLNEIQTNYSMLSSIPVANVAFIKVFRPGFVGGAGSGTGGAIVIYTKLGSDGEPLLSKGLDNSTVTGYTIIREFYSPNYDSENDTDKPDLRSTLYWNPSLITAPDQKSASFTFYNNDISHSFRVVIEGMDKEGKMTHIEKEITP